jgi:ribonuclease HII
LPGSRTPTRCGSRFEREAHALGYRRVAGLDEAGRGCLFGPVFAAAVILSPERPVAGLRDSKQLAAPRREELAALIRERAASWAVAQAGPEEIDRLNILQASRLAMKRAVEKLSLPPDYLLVDAITVDLPMLQRALIKGDVRCRSIAAASILAKVARDARMEEFDRIYPQYGLAIHKGYPTVQHIRALEQYGPTPLHRASFAPVRELLGVRQLRLEFRQEAARS